jgi:alkanesulfonate monooxygenase SsuD/methylene tetrahydromethanopterin reductase-like flavin-dependent oxidoreductase (luciferase family)
MKIGVQLPEVEFAYSWDDLLALAIQIEDEGFDSVWLGDHLMYRSEDPSDPPVGPFEAWTTLAAIAARTSRVELGPLVACLGFHNPAMVAKMAATVDAISGGRLIFGIGAGWNEPEFRGYGFPFDRRVDRFAESFTIIRTLFAHGECTFGGEFHSLDGAVLFPPVVRPGGPPLMIGSHGRRMLDLTLPHVAGWNAWYQDYDNSIEALASLLGEIDEACRRVGRDAESLERSICPLVTFDRGDVPVNPGRTAARTIDGEDTGALATEFGTYEAMGISHVQLVLDPITPRSIARAADGVRAYRASGT